jgi:hypothetical protein
MLKSFKKCVPCAVLNIQVFWDTTPCKLAIADVSEKLFASIYRV